jgi:hypothetical protein
MCVFLCVCVCVDEVVNFLRLSHSVSLQVYEIVFDITHTKLPTALCCLKGDRSRGVVQQTPTTEFPCVFFATSLKCFVAL